MEFRAFRAKKTSPKAKGNLPSPKIFCAADFLWNAPELPLHQEPGQNPASLAKPGQAGISGFLVKLTRKMRPGKAWQASPRPSFLGNLGHKSPAFSAMLVPRPDFLGNLGQKKKKNSAFLATKMLARLSWIFSHWKVVVRSLAFFSWSESYRLFLLIPS